MKKILALILIALMAVSTFAACGGAGQDDQIETGAQGIQGDKGDKGDEGRGILKTEIIDGCLWITYSDAPNSPVNVGKVSASSNADSVGGSEVNEYALDFYPLPDGTYGVMAGNSKYLEKIVIPEKYNGKAVTKILDNAFGSAPNLKELVIPDSVTSIGFQAFDDCSSLMSITIPDSVTSIGSSAFVGCDSLKYNEYNNGKYLGNSKNPYIILVDVIDRSATSFTIHNTTKFIHSFAFENCSSLTSVTIPDSVTSIGFYAFCDCSSLMSVTIPDSVTSIGEGVFGGCSSLTNVTIPDRVTSIGDRAFYNCSSLISVTIPDSVTSIGFNAFAYSRLTSIEFKKTEGWKAGSTAISSTDLEDKGKAAEYLTDTYVSNSWTRS